MVEADDRRAGGWRWRLAARDMLCVWHSERAMTQQTLHFDLLRRVSEGELWSPSLGCSDLLIQHPPRPHSLFSPRGTKKLFLLGKLVEIVVSAL